MRSRKALEELTGNRHVQAILNLIKASEGADYDTLFGGATFSDMSRHPNIRKAFTQTDGKRNYSTAAGAYQILNKTAAALQKQYGFEDYKPFTQDVMALALLDQKGALDDVLAGDFESAINKSGSIWASLPSSKYKQPKKSEAFVSQFLAQQGVQNSSGGRIARKDVGGVIDGALAGLAAPRPEDGAFDAFAKLRRDKMQADADALALASIDQEADTTRNNAVRSFFGSAPTRATIKELPPALEDSLARALYGET